MATLIVSLGSQQRPDRLVPPYFPHELLACEPQAAELAGVTMPTSKSV